MDAESGAIQADPGESNGVVGSGREDEAASEGSCLGGFREGLGIEGVVGFLDGHDDMEITDGPFGGDLSDAAREVAE